MVQNTHDVVPDGPMTEQELMAVRALSAHAIAEIDRAILSNVTEQRRKVAMVVASAMSATEGIAPGVPDLYFAERVKALVAAAKLVAFGDLSYMRYSEVCLP